MKMIAQLEPQKQLCPLVENTVLGLNRFTEIEQLALNPELLSSFGKESLERVLMKPLTNFEMFLLTCQLEGIKQRQKVLKQNTILIEQLAQARGQLDYLEIEARKAEKARTKKELAKVKRESRLKLAQRDVITALEFNQFIEQLSGQRYTDARKRVAFTLLYLTGLRIENVRLLKVKQIKELLKQGKMVVSLVKRGHKRHTVIVSSQGMKTLQQREHDFSILLQGKDGNQDLFTNQKKEPSIISRISFDRELNQELIKASQRFGKHLRTHSFRATLITDLLENTPIDGPGGILEHTYSVEDIAAFGSRLYEIKL